MRKLRFPNLSRFSGAPYLFAAAFAVRVVLLFGLETFQDPGLGEVGRIAASFARTGTLADPFAIPTGPSAHAAPVYPVMVGLIHRAAGFGDAAVVVQQLVNVALVSLHYALLPALALALGLPRRVGVLAGLFGAIVPFHLLVELRGYEAPLAGLASVFLARATLATRWLESTRGMLLVGFAWGLGFLVTPALLSAALVILLVVAARGEAAGRSRRIGRAALVIVIAVLTTLPWTLRNELALGAPVWIKSNLGLELSFSNNDAAKATIYENMANGLFRSRHPVANRKLAARVRDLGEVRYNGEEMAQARAWIASHPAAFGRLTALRLAYFWFPMTPSIVQSLGLWLLTAAAAGGLAAMRRHKDGLAFGVIAGLWLTFPLLYYLVQYSSRYRYPLHWTFLIAAAALVSYWAALRHATLGETT